MRIPQTARRSNQSILKEINSDYSLGGLILKLKLQYFGHLMRRTDLSEKTLMLGGIRGKDGACTCYPGSKKDKQGKIEDHVFENAVLEI